MSNKSKRGRKSMYEILVKPHLNDIVYMIRYGKKKEKDICKDLGIPVSTFSKYKIEFPELQNALNKGKESFINQVSF